MQTLKEQYLNAFQEKMEMLNPEQRKAVETIDGPVVVIAGPGTGKTQILTLRIANILHRMGAAFAPNILALTFTNAGVLAMRKRLASFVGVDLAHQVGIFTFHSFAEEQIQSHPEIFARFAFSRAIDDIEKIHIIEEILKEGKWKYLQTFSSDYHYTQDIIRAIDTLKSEAISPDDFEKSLSSIRDRVLEKRGEDAYYRRKTTVQGKVYQEGDLKPHVEKEIEREQGKQKELLALYRAYQQALEERKLYDFSDMILSVVQEAEKNMDFRTLLQEQYMYLLIDEHQDTNEAQNKLITLIGEAEVNEGKPNIFTVGDEKQAIYRFQGASLETFLAFQKKYQEVTLIHLKNNYRSSQHILDAAHALIPGEVPLEAKNEAVRDYPQKVTVVTLPDRKSEYLYLAEEIQAKIQEGVPAHEIAIFFKQNKELDGIQSILEKYHIPYSVHSRENILDNREIRKMIFLLRAVEYPYQDDVLAKALFVDFLEIDPHDILKVLNRLRIRRGEESKQKTLLKLISSQEMLESLDLRDASKLHALGTFLADMKREEANLDFLPFFERFAHRSGFLKHLLSLQDNVSALQRFQKMFDEVRKQSEAKKAYRLSDFLRYLEVLEKYQLKIEVGGSDVQAGVQLMTAHGAKGLEFAHVYLTNGVDDLWGKGKRYAEKFLLPVQKNHGGTDDERRLFYVALTRGKKEVHISYAKVDENGREKLPSRFLEEIGDAHLTHLVPEEKSFQEKIEKFFAEREEPILSLFDKEYIRKLFLQNTLSVSALNNYYASPIKYFFRNLIRLPSAQTKPLIFGNIIHDALDQYFKTGKQEGRKPTKEELLTMFSRAMQKFSIPEAFFEEIRQHGEEVLSRYFDYYHEQFSFAVETEKRIFTEMELKNGERLKLYGIIDKMEMMPQGGIRVVDYKTGKTFPEKTKEQKADLERQLVFYKLLIDRHFAENRVREGVLDFVEPQKKTGSFVRELRVLQQDAVEMLEKEIQAFAEDIMSGAFLERRYEKNKENAEYYELWELLTKQKKG